MDRSASLVRRNFTLMAVAFELSLGALALAVLWMLDRSPWSLVAGHTPASILRNSLVGIATALPLLAVIILADRYPRGILRELRRTVRDEVVPLFRHTGPGGLLAISLAAGVGEELLFRGLVQTGLQDAVGPPAGAWLGLLLASALFGICHWLCTAYALVATGMGLLLGSLMLATGDLVAPIVTHAAYDFLALLYLVREPPSAGDA